MRVKGWRGNPGLKGRLLSNSVDAYILALETINRLSVSYRVEAFTYLICNAWELLLKAHMINQSRNPRAIYYPKQRGERPRTISLRDSVKRVYPVEKEPIRRNIEIVADLRDEAVHLVISQVPKDVLALLQACVLNYHKELGHWFGVSLSDVVPVGMMTIVYDLTPDHFDLGMPALRKQLGKDTAMYLAQLRADILSEHQDLDMSAEFSIVFDYKLALTKKRVGADVQLSSGEGGERLGLVEVPRDPARTHPMRMKELHQYVQAVLGERRQINFFDIQCVIKSYNVTERSEYYYQSKLASAPKQYSREFGDWMIESFNRNENFFDECRAKAK